MGNESKKERKKRNRESLSFETVEGDKHLCQEDWLCSRGEPMENHHKQAHGDQNENSSGLGEVRIVWKKSTGDFLGQGKCSYRDWSMRCTGAFIC